MTLAMQTSLPRWPGNAAMNRDLVDTLHEVVSLFERLELSYAVMGGLAARVHGIPRPTYDIDFALSIDRDDLGRMFDAAEELGYHVPVAYRSGWVDSVAGMPIVKLGMRIGDQGMDIDVFLVEGEFLRSVLARRSRHDIGGLEMWLVSPEDLIVLKAAAYRDRDKSDIQDVLFMQGELDRDYMRDWAERLGILAQLNQALAKYDADPGI